MKQTPPNICASCKKSIMPPCSRCFICGGYLHAECKARVKMPGEIYEIIVCPLCDPNIVRRYKNLMKR